MVIQILAYTANIINEKVDTFTDSMVEDIQDIIKVELDDNIDFNHGILPPRYKELKEEMKEILSAYVFENMFQVSHKEAHME